MADHAVDGGGGDTQVLVSHGMVTWGRDRNIRANSGSLEWFRQDWEWRANCSWAIDSRSS
ncbi:hypothetical protein [Roseibium aggregatum]|uniref:hypothetical protein n=1 Tax=Roseibium aggregatum TaxID=187304 RepID=UPI0025AC02AD|nr:hypothetical protein [Roseibium aggregatum]WJS05889.1 hypothetical protein QUB73_28665 [Roseibium aggregatum]